MIESFIYATWIGGQALYWFFLRYQTQLYGALYWEALQHRIGREFLTEE